MTNEQTIRELAALLDYAVGHIEDIKNGDDQWRDYDETVTEARDLLTELGL